MKDNATMFFIVSIISTVAFTAIGTTAALGNKDLVRMTNPYTLLYMAPENNKIADKHLSIIKTIWLMLIFRIEWLHLHIYIQKVMYM